MKQLTSLLAERGIELSLLQIRQFDAYYQHLLEWNQKMNLTAITDKKDVEIKHFFDSLTPSFYFSFQGSMELCDVGSGAGFPSIPLKILCPDLHITILDSLKKRLVFLDSLINVLGLDHVSLHHDRAEIFAHKRDFRETFDIVTARAVANLSVLSEYCLPLVKEGGTFIALKGANAEEEIHQAGHAIDLLGGKMNKVESLILPEENSRRHLLFIDKIKKTPKKYPRKPGTPSKDPL